MSPKKKERKIIKRSPLSLFQRIEEAVRKRTESDYQELERKKGRDYCNKERDRGILSTNRSYCPTSRGVPREDRHTSKRPPALGEESTGHERSTCFRDGDRKSITGHARNLTRDRGNRAKYVFGNCSISFSMTGERAMWTEFSISISPRSRRSLHFSIGITLSERVF